MPPSNKRPPHHQKPMLSLLFYAFGYISAKMIRFSFCYKLLKGGNVPWAFIGCFTVGPPMRMHNMGLSVCLSICQNKLSLILKIISTATPRSLCDSTIKALVLDIAKNGGYYYFDIGISEFGYWRGKYGILSFWKDHGQWRSKYAQSQFFQKNENKKFTSIVALGQLAGWLEPYPGHTDQGVTFGLILSVSDHPP